MALERELQTYLREKPMLLADGKEGRFALIFGEKVDSVWHCQTDALDVGYGKFYPQPFMVKQINEKEPVYTV
jgi:hypothetical protein